MNVTRALGDPCEANYKLGMAEMGEETVCMAGFPLGAGRAGGQAAH